MQGIVFSSFIPFGENAFIHRLIIIVDWKTRVSRNVDSTNVNSDADEMKRYETEFLVSWQTNRGRAGEGSAATMSNHNVIRRP